MNDVPFVPDTAVPEIAPARSPRQPLAMAVFALLAFAILYATAKILAAYLTSILLALIIVTFSFKMYERLTVRMKGRNQLAAIVMLLFICLAIILPAVIIGVMLFDQAATLVKTLQETDMQSTFANFHLAERLSFVKRFVPSFDPSAIQIEPLIIRAVKQIPGFIVAHGTAFVGGFASAILGFFLMLIAAYYFYVEGRDLAKNIVFLSPLPDEYDEELFRRFRGVIDATFRGQILTALAQGFVTALGLWIAGVPAFILWGAVAAIAALIPMVGPAMIWIPSAIYLFAGLGARGGGVGWGLFMIAWGVVVVGLVDNIIRPWAMKGGIEMSAIVLFFAILGGLQAFGFIGLVLGPLVFALLDTVIHMYKHFFRSSLAHQNKT
jgi:predicted PurR-regulated permease PerM